MPSLVDQIYSQASNASAGGKSVGIGQSDLAQNQSLIDLWSTQSAGQTGNFLNQISQDASHFLVQQPITKPDNGTSFMDRGLFGWLHDFFMGRDKTKEMTLFSVPGPVNIWQSGNPMTKDMALDSLNKEGFAGDTYPEAYYNWLKNAEAGMVIKETGIGGLR